MARCVFRGTVEGTTVPHRSLRPINDVWQAWAKEQGIGLAFVHTVEVTEYDDGSLVAYCRRYELNDGPPEPGRSRVKVAPYSSEPSFYLTHHPVTSIQMLLDEVGPAPELVGA